MQKLHDTEIDHACVYIAMYSTYVATTNLSSIFDRMSVLLHFAQFYATSMELNDSTAIDSIYYLWPSVAQNINLAR